VSFYVSAIKGEKRALVCGPFRTHGAALKRVHVAKRAAEKLFKDADHLRTAWGTAQHKTGHPVSGAVAAVNEALGLELDAQGYVRGGVAAGE
jgi:hypothetical protein